MNQLITFSNPFDPNIADILDFIDDIKIDKKYNTTYRITCNIKDEIKKNVISSITEISYTYLFICTMISSDNLYDFIELFNRSIYHFLGIEPDRVQIIYLQIEDDIYTKIIPYFEDDRIYLSEEAFARYINKYNNLLQVNNLFISNDELFQYASKLLEEKRGGIKIESNKVEKLAYIDNKNIEDVNQIDFIITKLKQQDLFSLEEFKDDVTLSVVLEVVKAFEFEKINDQFLIFKSVGELNKNWLLKSTFRILNNQLPTYRLQTNNYIDEIDITNNGLKAKIKLCAVLSCKKLGILFNDNIIVHSDLSVQIEVLELENIGQFNEYMALYLQRIEEWSDLLCSSIGQAVTIREMIKSTKIGSFESYIINIEENEYLIVLTNNRELIKVDVKNVTYDKNIDRGYKLDEIKSVNLENVLVIDQDKDCDNKNIYVMKYNNQNLFITKDSKEMKNKEEQMNNVKSNWINFYVSKYGLMSELITFV